MGRPKGQVSMEYLAVVGLSLFLLLPMIVVFFDKSNDLTDEINAAHVEKVAFELRDAAEEVFLLGEPTQVRLRVYLPDHVNAITLEQDAIQVNLSVTGANVLVRADSSLPINLTGSIPVHGGLHIIAVKATSSGVNIDEIS